MKRLFIPLTAAVLLLAGCINVMVNLPESSSIPPQLQPYEMWVPLVGYWNAAEGRYFLLDMADSHSAYLETGLWETENAQGGYVTTLTLEDGIYRGSVALERGEESFAVDGSGLEQDGKLRITLGGEIYQCARAGNTAEEAYAVYLDNKSGN